MAEPEKRRSLVREAALDRIASQERLDVLNDVTRAPDRFVLAAVGLLVAVAILWGLFGSVQVKVAGEGILIQGGEVRAVMAQDPGMIEEVLVAEGEEVKAGQDVARLSRAQILRDLAQCRSEAGLSGAEESGVIQGLIRQLAGLRQREKVVETLVRRGRLPRIELENIQTQITTTEARINSGNQKIRALAANCQRLEAMVNKDAVIRSAATGRIIDVGVREGDTVAAGAQILTLEPHGDLEAQIFVPVRDGKRIEIGMQAHLSPSHIRPEEDGYLVAQVISVTRYPATPESLEKILRDKGLARRLVEQGPLYRVGLKLGVKNADEFIWTGKGSNERIESGTLTRASVLIERRTPAEYVLPILRRLTGAS